MNRHLSSLIANDLARKMVLVTGPRQVGKTTLARALGDQFSNPLYLNYDQIADRLRIQNTGPTWRTPRRIPAPPAPAWKIWSPATC